MTSTTRITGILIAGALAASSQAQSGNQNDGSTPPALLQNFIRPAPPSPISGVPAKLPGPTSLGGVQAPGGVPSRATPIRQIPIVQTPQPTPPVVDGPKAPAPNDGSAGIARLRRHRDDGVHIHRGNPYPYYDYGYYNPSYYYDPYAYIGAQQNYIVDPRLTPQPAVVIEQPPPPATPLEAAELALRIGNTDEALKQLKLHLKKDPDDAGAERLMALALLDDRKVEKAVAVLLHAYTKQPSLARDAIDPSALSGGEMNHRQRFNRVMTYANRTKLSSALLAASILAQSEERYDVATKLLDRAVAEGLDKKVADEMTMALTNR